MNNDLISRSALKKRIQLNDETWEEFYDAVMYEIDNAPTVTPTFGLFKEMLCSECEERPQGEWILVSERLPEDMQRVLIWFEYYRYGDFNCMYQTYGFGYVCDGKWSPFINGETGWQDYKVIAWQPLPEPYEKGGAE